MPKRKPALRPQQPAPSRKKAKQRIKPLPPPPIAFPTRATAVPEEEPAPPVLQEVPARRPAGSRLPGRDYAYVKRELQRIAMTATLIVVLLIVLSFVIR